MYNKIYITCTILLRVRFRFRVWTRLYKFIIILISISSVSFFNHLEILFSKNILYTSMPLILIRECSLPFKMLYKPHFSNDRLIRTFCFFTRSQISPTHFVVKTCLSPAVSFPSTYITRFASKCCSKSSRT